MRVARNEQTGVVTLNGSFGELEAKWILPDTYSSRTFVDIVDGRYEVVSGNRWMVGANKNAGRELSLDNEDPEMAELDDLSELFSGGSTADKETIEFPYRMLFQGTGVEDHQGISRLLMLYYSKNGIKWDKQVILPGREEELEEFGNSIAFGDLLTNHSKVLVSGDGGVVTMRELFDWDSGGMLWTEGVINLGEMSWTKKADSPLDDVLVVKRMKSTPGFILTRYRMVDGKKQKLPLKLSLSDRRKFKKLMVYYNSDNPLDYSKWNIFGRDRVRPPKQDAKPTKTAETSK